MVLAVAGEGVEQRDVSGRCEAICHLETVKEGVERLDVVKRHETEEEVDHCCRPDQLEVHLVGENAEDQLKGRK